MKLRTIYSRRGGVVAPSGSPYTWFPSLDKSTIPFHAASGPWGAQRVLQEAAAPVTTSTGTAGTNAQFVDACNTPGTQVTLTAVLESPSASTGNITDVDVIIPPGTGLLRPGFGRAASPFRQITRLRFRGNTLGQFSGGQFHNGQLHGPYSDVIFDGIAMSGPGGTSGSSALHATKASEAGGSATRLAIQYVRARCGGGWLLASVVNDLVVCGCSILTAEDTADPVDAWGLRLSRDCTGIQIVYGNDIRASTARGGLTNNTYHRQRTHPHTGMYYNWTKSNTFIDRVQARIYLVDAAFGGGTGTLDGAWFDNNLVIATYASGASGQDCQIKDALYGRITNNTFQSDRFTSTANLTLGAPVVDGDKTTGNVFQALPGSDPAWGAAGDPSAIDWEV